MDFARFRERRGKFRTDQETPVLGVVCVLDGHVRRRVVQVCRGSRALWRAINESQWPT
jgi:hypothetical protein